MAMLRGRWTAARGPISPEFVRDLDGRGIARSHANLPIAIDSGALAQALDFDDPRFPNARPLDAATAVG